MLIRLIYASEAAQPLTPDSVQVLVDQARAANARRNVTGLLVFDHRAFLQTLEGEREVVSDIYNRIARDSRHRRVVLMESRQVDERLFLAWTMGFAAANALGRDQFLRFGGTDGFDPHAMTGASALGLLRALSSQAK